MFCSITSLPTLVRFLVKLIVLPSKSAHFKANNSPRFAPVKAEKDESKNKAGARDVSERDKPVKTRGSQTY